MHCFCLLFNSREWNNIYNLQGQAERMPKPRSLAERLMAWSLQATFGFCWALGRVLTAHLILELVCMEGPVQVHSFRSWSHFASDTVDVVVVVDSLGAERSSDMFQTVAELLKKRKLNGNPILFKKKGNLLPFFLMYYCASSNRIRTPQ